MSRIDPRDPAIVQALEKIFNDKDPTNWVLLGYAPRSNNVLEVKGTGTEGWEEMCEEISDGKVSYGLCQFKVNEVNRYVYLSWLGEGVQGLQKGQYNNHAIDMQRVFRGYHVQIYGRNDGDLELDDVLRQLKTGIGADYDAGQRVQGDKKGTPVCAPIKVDRGEIDKEASAQFWDSQKFEENSVGSGYKKSNDFQNINDRDQFWKQESSSAPASAPAKKEPEIRAQTGNLKSKFEQLAVEQSEPPKRVQATAPPPKRNAAPAPSAAPPKPAAPAAAAPPKPAPAAAPPKPAAPAPAPAAAPPKPAAPAPPTKAQPPPPPTAAKPKAPEPVQETYEESYEEEGYAEEGGEYYEEEGYAEEGGEYYEEEGYAEEGGEYEEEGYAEEGGEYYEEEGATETALALYPYSSPTEGDLNFQAGETINILDRSEDWWKGELNGVVGYFPSNFVRLN